MVDPVSHANQGPGKTANQGTEQLGQLIGQGRALAKAKKVQEAIAIFEQALALDPDNNEVVGIVGGFAGWVDGGELIYFSKPICSQVAVILWDGEGAKHG